MPRIDPAAAGGSNVCAFLDMLAWSEGTTRIKGSDDGYNVIVGGALFDDKGTPCALMDDYNDHPRKLVHIPQWKVKSTAAGRYQLLARYYDAYRRLLKLSDFSPLSQDLIAIQQIREQRALPALAAGDFDTAVRRCANIWASLPGAGYGQYEHTIDRLRLEFIKAGGVTA